jgi:flagellar hook-basal body complex protein FliE
MSGFEVPPLIGQDLRMRAPPLVGDKALPAGQEGQAGAAGPSAFAGALSDALQHVSELQNEAQAKAAGISLGQPVSLSDLMISMGKSEVAFNLMLEVRNKLLDAWDKLSRAVV